jgi:23S rRNA A2030 N6-methylase RlmJ
MTDQRSKAGNIGDVFKHAVLPELVLLWCRETSGAATYVETHAGFYKYDLKWLRSKNRWLGERAWSLGVEADAITDGHIGVYGSALLAHLHSGTYPGSVRLVEFATRFLPTPPKIVGFDLAAEQISSFDEASEQVSVEEANGFDKPGYRRRAGRNARCGRAPGG